jgi:glycosyltransferase involved in cell wall biosynthesis/SAM-dependent methyltransferase
MSDAMPTQPIREGSTSGPLVSVVIVCYNQARYLPEAIESALAQTCTDREVILVDDGSTDDTQQVGRRYSGVHYIHQANRGLAAARNTGLRAAGGQYVLFLDADDKLLPHAIEAGLDCWRAFPASGFVCGAYRNIFDDGSPAPTSPQQRVSSGHYLRLLEGNFIGMHAVVLYRRDLLETAGGFDESLRACEDYELYLRMSRRWPIAQHYEIVAEYRQHDTNMSKDYAFMLRSVLGVLRKERDHLADRARRRARRRGVGVWKDYYGDLLLIEWGVQRGARRFLKILRLHPVGVLRHAGKAFRRRLCDWRDRRWVRMGTLRRLSPISQCFGFDRGLPLDRHYIESFLAEHSHEICGHVLEIGDDEYSRRFGGSRVTKQDVLHVEPGFPGATIIANLASAPEIPDGRFDCIILTQTLHYIFDLQGAIATLHRILKPGGTLLATLPGISRLCTDQADKRSDCWRFTESSAERLFSRSFGSSVVAVRSYGNVLAAISFLEGLAAHELRRHELDHHDPHFPVTIAVTAVKQGIPHEIPSVSLETCRASLSSDREGNIGSMVVVRDA